MSFVFDAQCAISCGISCLTYKKVTYADEKMDKTTFYNKGMPKGAQWLQPTALAPGCAPGWASGSASGSGGKGQEHWGEPLWESTGWKGASYGPAKGSCDQNHVTHCARQNWPWSRQPCAPVTVPPPLTDPPSPASAKAKGQGMVIPPIRPRGSAGAVPPPEDATAEELEAFRNYEPAITAWTPVDPSQKEACS